MPIFWLLIFWAIVWICKNAAEDVMGAVKGRPSPRRVRQLKRIEESGGTPGYGLGGFARDFADDFLRERTAKRRELAAAKRQPAEPEPADVPKAEPGEVDTFTPRAEDRHVDPLGLLDDSRPPKVGQVHYEEGTNARYRWDGQVWWKTHNADGSEIPKCPSCGRYRYKAVGDGCGNCRPVTPSPDRETAAARAEAARLAALARIDGLEAPELPNMPDGLDHGRCLNCGAPMRPVPGTQRFGAGGRAVVSTRCSGCGSIHSATYWDWADNPPAVNSDDPTGQDDDAQKENRQPTSSAPTATVIPIFRTPNHPNQEDPMSTEVTGLATAIDYAAGVAQAHESHATDAETFAASLASNGVGDSTVGLVAQAAEASGQAAAAWAAVRGALEEQVTVKEAYEATPDAGDKDFVTAE